VASKAAGMAKGMGGKFVGKIFFFHIDASASPSACHQVLSYKKLNKKLVVNKKKRFAINFQSYKNKKLILTKFFFILSDNI
jgi:hypothetical protein